MKKLILIVTALAMVATFMPQLAVGDDIPRPWPVPTDSANLNLKVTFDLEKPEPIIAIALDRANLNFEGMKLGEVRNGEIGVANKGNVSVMVDIGYYPVDDLMYDAETGRLLMLVPGTKQDVNTYVTMVNGNVIPPHGMVKLGALEEEKSKDVTAFGLFELSFGAPTEITVPVEGISVSYELRAYPAWKM